MTNFNLNNININGVELNLSPSKHFIDRWNLRVKSDLAYFKVAMLEEKYIYMTQIGSYYHIYHVLIKIKNKFFIIVIGYNGRIITILTDHIYRTQLAACNLSIYIDKFNNMFENTHNEYKQIIASLTDKLANKCDNAPNVRPTKHIGKYKIQTEIHNLKQLVESLKIKNQKQKDIIYDLRPNNRNIKVSQHKLNHNLTQALQSIESLKVKNQKQKDIIYGLLGYDKTKSQINTLSLKLNGDQSLSDDEIQNTKNEIDKLCRIIKLYTPTYKYNTRDIIKLFY